MNWELVINLFSILTPLAVGLAWNIRKMYESYLTRHKCRSLVIKGINEKYDINAQGLSEDEFMNLVKQLRKR